MSTYRSESLSSLGALVRRDEAKLKLKPAPTSSSIITVPTAPLRTLDDIRNQVAHEVAMRAIAKGRVHDGVRTGVCLTFSKSSDETFLFTVGSVIQENLLLQDHLFIIGTTGGASDESSFPATREIQTVNTLLICGSSFDQIDRARLLTGSKFLGRIVSATDTLPNKQWLASVIDLGASPYDEDALWDVAVKAVRGGGTRDPKSPPEGSKGIEEMLEEARARLVRLTPEEAFAELVNGGSTTAFLVDIRPAEEREREGGIGGSLIIERNVLEWRFDPRCEARLTIADRYDLRVIVFCQEGYTSSLAAYSLQQLGLSNATDIIGGYKAWREAGLPYDGPEVT
ncbi:Rhodanese-like domain-containing protein [Amanita rubescens]|nr:Rhodanese-like domain-containing protein [Amanita rubescens]